MLIWINGAFGGGKTQTAHEMARRAPGSVISDPEELGFGLHRMTPPALRGDFQDQPSWRAGVVDTLHRIAGAHGGPIIVPMTILEPTYLDETVGRLRERGHDVRHFALLAQRETVVRRLRERGFGAAVQVVSGRAARRRESFALAKLDLALERLPGPEFAVHIGTDELTIAQVADRIAAAVGLTLAANTDSALRGRLRRARVGLQHIRFD